MAKLEGMHPASKKAHEHWRPIVAAQARSGKSAAAFCRERGLWPSSFFRWKRILEAAESAPGFVEVRPAAALEATAGREAGTGGVTVEVCGGRRLRVERGFDGELLRQLLRVLEAEA